MQIEEYKTDKLNLNEFISHYHIDIILNNDLIKKSYFELYNQEELINKDMETTEYLIRQELENYPPLRNPKPGVYWAPFILLEEIYTYYYYPEFTLLELLTMDPDEALEELSGAIYEYCSESVLNTEIYQYFIVSEYDADRYLNKYLNYPIYYSEELNIYLLGIPHCGTSWSFFFTEAPRPEYLKIKKYDEVLAAPEAAP